MLEFKKILRKTVSKLFLRIWIPYGEDTVSNIDISFGFVFDDDPNKLYVISVDNDELWSPYIYHFQTPKKVYTYEEFYPMVKMWMNSINDNFNITNEFFDVTNWEIFKNITNSEIIKIELIKMENNPEPFGIKIIFNNDYIVSTPISDGNTVETSQFNNNNNIEIFKKIGNIIYESVE